MTNETKHTPGPWEVTDNTADGYGQLVVGSMHGAVAICYTAEPGDPGMPSECEANARLIAAAPELLAQLVKMTDAYAKAMKDAGVTYYPEALADVRHARAAIAKATGGKA